MEKKVIKTVAILLAAGSGKRMNSATPKQQMSLAGHSVLFHAANALENAETVTSVVAVVREDEIAFAEEELFGFRKVIAIVSGGETRMDSCRCGLRVLPEDAAFVAFHDAARCLATSELIDGVVRCAVENGAATAVSLVADTVKAVGKDGHITQTIPRDGLRLAETPQVFAVEKYRAAMLHANDSSLTDDCQLFEQMGIPVATVVSQTPNFKITTQNDFHYAAFLLEARQEGKGK